MKIRDQEITLPTSMVGNYPNPRWWDANFARFFTAINALLILLRGKLWKM
jgi:hypothetical protein